MGYVPPSWQQFENTDQSALYSDDSSQSPEEDMNLKRKVVLNYFKAATGRAPSNEELNTLQNMDASTYRQKIGAIAKGWSLTPEGNTVHPSETEQEGFVTPEQQQELGGLYSQLDASQKAPITGGTLGEILSGTPMGGVFKGADWLGGKFKQANIQNQIDAIERPGVNSQTDDSAYEDSTVSVPSGGGPANPQSPASQQTPVNQAIGGTPSGSDKYSLSFTPSDDPIIKMQQELMQYSSNLKKPYMEWGDDVMGELKMKLSEGAFKPDGSKIENFQFNELLDDFDIQSYGEQRPEITKFQAGEAPEMYDTGTPYTPQGQAPELNTQDVYQRGAYQGRDVMTDYQRYQGQDAPDMRNVSDQFQTKSFEQEGQRPDVYRARQAPGAEYYDPSGQQVTPAYQAKEFNVQDDPGYQRRYDQAMKAVEASAAAKGMQLSGATLKRLQEEAANIASEETQAAYARHADERGFEAGQEREDYGREQTQQDRIANAMQFKNEDQYRRYLDNVGIRRDEQMQLIDQFNQDRSFGANQNKENWLREQATKQLGRDLNQDEFSRWMQTEGKDYAQYANQRDWTTSQGNLAADRDWQQYTYGTGFDAAQNAEQFGRDVTKYQADTSDYRWQQGTAKSAEQEAFERDKGQYSDKADMYKYGTNLGFQADQAFQGAQQAAYGQDKQDFSNLQDKNWQQNLFNIGQQGVLQGQQYGQLQDVYGMDATAKAQDYGTLKDVLNTGLGVQDASIGMGGNYANFMTDWNVNQANLQNALKKQKSDKAWNALQFASSLFK